MTDQDLIDYYANLLILQYVGQPKAYATMQALAGQAIIGQLPSEVQDAFNLDTAVGVQLDVLGKYAGVTRSGPGFTAPITLDDDDFRVLIKFAIIVNQSGSSLAEIQELLFQFFPGSIYVFDYKNMRMSYLVDSDLGSQDLIQLLITQGLLPKPMGVELATVIYTPDLKFFGMLSASQVAAYAEQNSITTAQAATDIFATANIWQFNSVDDPIVGQWLSAQQGVIE